MVLEHILTKRFKQNTKWTAKVTNISKYVKNPRNHGIPIEELFNRNSLVL